MKKTYKCSSCGKDFQARAADRNRGWARFCSKSCKAIKQTQRTGIGQEGRSKARQERIGARHVRWSNEHGGYAQYDANGDFEGIRMSPEDLSHGGYGDADAFSPFGDGKY